MDVADAAPVSRTAAYVAAGRALGAREPDAAARNPDYLAEKLLGDTARLDVDHPAVRAVSLPYDEAMRDLEVAGIVRTMTVRTRFIDEAFERAVAEGASQVVILGAGFDSHAYRFADLLQARSVRIFEVDRPATQAFKRARVDEVLGGPPANLIYVPVDFRRDDLRESMVRRGYDPSLRTFFILEGVTMYLPEADVLRTLRLIGAHPPGSAVVFDFVGRALVDMLARLDVSKVPPMAKPLVERFLNLVRDEPWLFGFPSGSEREYLAELGLELREALAIGGEESVKRYLTRTDGTQVGAEALAAAAARFAAGTAGEASTGRGAETGDGAKTAGGASTSGTAGTPGAAQLSLEQRRALQRSMAHQVAVAIVAPTRLMSSAAEP
ncbi:MAG TPA: SAM-dependent methyltransferase [Gammaproteobacteria bacterium]|nr:SAM-dependent methyltransferase [Gammaproteobacteria bacterium]